MTTPTTSTTTSAVVEMTVEQREQLEVIASTYPTQDDLIAATTVYAEYKDGEIDTTPIFMVCMENEKFVRLSKADMDKLVALYVENKKLVAIVDKASSIKTMSAVKAKSGNGCAYVARNLD
jgi:hypothetical protein